MKVSDIICPQCQVVVNPDDINMAANRVLCRHCQQLFSLEDSLLSYQDEQLLKLESHPFHIEKTPYGCIWSFRLRYQLAALLMAVALAFMSGSGYFLYIMLDGNIPYERNGQQVTGGSMREILVIGLFFIVFLGVFILGLYVLLGKTHIEIRNGKGRVIKSLFGFSKSREFIANDTLSVKVIRSANPQHGKYTHHLEINTDRKVIKLGTGHKEADLNYLAASLRQYCKKKA